MAAKYARHEKFVIKQDEDKSITVFKEYDNVKASLRDIAEQLGFKVDPKWNTRQFGSKLVKKHGNQKGYAFAGNNGVYVRESGSVNSYTWYENTTEGLREIAKEAGFKVDAKWNTRQFGAKLMDFLDK